MNAVQECLVPSNRECVRGFPPLPNTGFALINYFHEEALGCLEAGLDQAAVMATNVLFEATCKLLVTAHDIGSGISPLRAIMRWNNVPLDPLIKELGERQIIPAEQVALLHEKRRSFRNFFQHGNTPLINLEKVDPDEIDDMGMVAGLFVMHAIGLMTRVQQVSFDWFLFVDREVRNRVPWKEIAASLGGTIELAGKDGTFRFGRGAAGVLSRPRDICGRPTEFFGKPVAKCEDQDDIQRGR